MTTTLIILAIAAFLFVQGSIRSDLVAACALLALLLTGVLTVQEALSGFSNPIVIMLVSLFIVGGAVLRTGLAALISKKIVGLAGKNESRLFVLIMLVTCGLGAFVSNTGTTAVMMPIVISLSLAAGASPSRFLMPLAFASALGGMLTLVGNTPNMIINSALIAAGHPALQFFSFAPIGFICVGVGIPFLFFASKYLVKAHGTDKVVCKEHSMHDLAGSYGLWLNEYRAGMRSGSSLIGQTLSGSAMREKYGINLVEIRRTKGVFSFLGNRRQEQRIIPGPDTVFAVGDVLAFVGPEENIARFTREYSLDLMDITEAEEDGGDYDFSEIGIAELVLLSQSRLVGRKVRDSALRETYDVRVLGIRRKGVSVLWTVPDTELLAGDTLLVQGAWKNIALLSDAQNEWVVNRPFETASKGTLEHKAPVAAVIVLTTIAVMGLGLLEPVTAAMLAAMGIILTGCYRNVEEAYSTINWESIVLVAAMLSMAVALEKTGAAALASGVITGAMGSSGPYVLLGLVYVVTSIVTLFISNTAAAALCTPVAFQIALSMQLSPSPFLYAVATAASISLAVPFSTPPNVLVMSPGRYTFMDYVKVGGPLQILFCVIMVFALPMIFPFTAQ
jgi:di/tricarboxylate transporter